jgi:hypothetical protein
VGNRRGDPVPTAYVVHAVGALDPEKQLPLAALLGLAVYSLIIFSMAGSPLEKIKQ